MKHCVTRRIVTLTSWHMSKTLGSQLMETSQFDNFAAEYCAFHAANIGVCGEDPKTGTSVPFLRKHLPGAGVTLHRCLEREFGVSGAADARRDFFGSAENEFCLPLERWTTWLPLGAQYYVVAVK